MKGVQFSPFIEKVFDLFFGKKQLQQQQDRNAHDINRDFERALLLVNHSKFQKDTTLGMLPKRALLRYTDELFTEYATYDRKFDNAVRSIRVMFEIPHIVDFVHWFQKNLTRTFRVYCLLDRVVFFRENAFLYENDDDKAIIYNRGLYCYRYLIDNLPVSHHISHYTRLYVEIKVFYQDSILSWMIISKRLRIPRDVALLIARQVWEHRFSGGK